MGKIIMNPAGDTAEKSMNNLDNKADTAQPTYLAKPTDEVRDKADAANDNADRQATSKPSRIEIRKELAACVKDACMVLTDAGFEKLAKALVNLIDKANRDKFSVSFVGEFSHGKSTLINKLLDEEVVPTDTLPTTSLLTHITYGNKNLIEVTDRQGKKLQVLPLQPKSWEKLVAYDEEGSPTNLDIRSRLNVTVDNEWLRESGIVIYDTPGANEANKERDIEISKALMVTDGAVVCIDAQKGVTMTQETFITDRLLSPKVPFIAIAITHLDLIIKENRDRVIANIIGKLRTMKASLPVVITNDVEMSSDTFSKIVGIDKLRRLMSSWKNNPQRAERIEAWLATGTQAILDMAVQALEQKKQILSAKGDERAKIIVEKQNAITRIHEEWEKVRESIKLMCDACHQDFKRKLDQEKANIIKSMLYRIDNVNAPDKWYEKNYEYEIATRVSASIIALDNYVTEIARNDFDKINRDVMSTYRVALERDGKAWSRTPDSAAYVHKTSPELTDIGAMQEQSTKISAAATAAGGLLATLLFGVGGIVGTVGASTVVRMLTKNKIDKEIEAARDILRNYVEEDVKNVMNAATTDCLGRISLLYADMARAIYTSESEWMNTQMDMIKKTAQPEEDEAAKTEESIQKKIDEFNKISESFNKFTE